MTLENTTTPYDVLCNSSSTFDHLNWTHGCPYPGSLHTKYGLVAQTIVGVVCFAILAVGVPTNLLIITSICAFRCVRTRNNVFLASLAAKDIVFLTLAAPIFAFDFIQGRYPFGRIMCTVQMTLAFSLGLSSVVELTNIALSRYLRVCWPHETHARLYSRRNTVLLASTSWLIGLSLGIPTTLVTCKLDTQNGLCFMADAPLKAATSTSVLLTTCCVTSFCYFKIFRKVQKSHDNAHRRRSGAPQRQEARKYFRTSLRDFCVLAVYIILLLPYLMVNAFGLSTPRHLLWDISKILSYLNNVSNCIIYGLLNRQLRRCFARLLGIDRMRCGSPSNVVTPATISQVLPPPPEARPNGTVTGS
ncbi:melatonin receptor type 1A [Aplysia californica]|uniref:Melatonin receptor type 1A n=1 Tax=Aplysia californica TaxID=6500 RepID=A0ABM1AAZ2_APLCA|nr:melatonin receptor type 1A [Aplysia californica]